MKYLHKETLKNVEYKQADDHKPTYPKYLFRHPFIAGGQWVHDSDHLEMNYRLDAERVWYCWDEFNGDNAPLAESGFFDVEVTAITDEGQKIIDYMEDKELLTVEIGNMQDRDWAVLLARIAQENERYLDLM